jgi:hypothetical protein
LAARGIRTSYYRPKGKSISPFLSEQFTINVDKDYPPVLDAESLRAKYPGINEESLKILNMSPEERAEREKAAMDQMNQPGYAEELERQKKDYELQLQLQREKNIAEQNKLMRKAIADLKAQLEEIKRMEYEEW